MEANDSMIRLAMETLDVSEEDAKTYNTAIPDIECWYFWTPARGGRAMIVNEKGERLVAPSLINYNEHVAEFRRGKRN